MCYGGVDKRIGQQVYRSDHLACCPRPSTEGRTSAVDLIIVGKLLLVIFSIGYVLLKIVLLLIDRRYRSKKR
jgi:hypothetical protein